MTASSSASSAAGSSNVLPSAVLGHDTLSTRRSAWGRRRSTDCRKSSTPAAPRMSGLCVFATFTARTNSGGQSVRASRAATASAPSLLRPIRLTSARSSGRRNALGCGLPPEASAVTEPTSAKPKPSACPHVDASGVLVEPGRQTHRGVEPQAPQRLRQPLVAPAVERAHSGGSQRPEADRAHPQAVRSLCVGAKEEGADQAVHGVAGRPERITNARAARRSRADLPSRPYQPGVKLMPNTKSLSWREKGTAR